MIRLLVLLGFLLFYSLTLQSNKTEKRWTAIEPYEWAMNIETGEEIRYSTAFLVADTYVWTFAVILT